MKTIATAQNKETNERFEITAYSAYQLKENNPSYFKLKEQNPKNTFTNGAVF